METFIRDAFIKKEHVVAVFFDLEKAYDTTWRYGILKDIHKLGLRGRLPTFIENFLADRTMQVRVGSSLSDYYDQEQGVPQGGVLSTTLFSIKINDIVKCLGNLTDCSLYVDDFCICYRSKSMATIERQLQQNLNKIENWATSNGLKFSKSKTQCVHFCQLRKQHNDPVLHLYGSPIQVVEESKFLGILFDKYLKAKCFCIESFKSAFPYFLGCRPNYTSQAVSVSSPVKIRLWLYYIWLCTKIISSNA